MSARAAAAAVCAYVLSGCQCLQAPSDLSQYSFSVYHSRNVVIYRKEPGQTDDVAYVYLSLQNDSPANCGMCFEYWSNSEQKWTGRIFASLVPVISVASEGAPIIGQPEVRTAGLSGQSIAPGHRFPEIVPDATEFPLNEASYRRDFVIVLRPDRSLTGTGGAVDVRVSLAHLAPRPDEKASPVAHFRIPVSISDQFRPEGMTVETAEMTK